MAIDYISSSVEKKKKQASNSWRTYYEHLILIFFFLKFSYCQVTQRQPHDVKKFLWILLKVWHAYTRTWEHNTSTENTYKTQKWANPLSYKDRWLSNYIMSCKILLQCLRNLWFYHTSWVSFYTPVLLSSSLVRLFPEAYKSSSASRVQLPTKEIFIWCWRWHIFLISFFHNLYYISCMSPHLKWIAFDFKFIVKAIFQVLSPFIPYNKFKLSKSLQTFLKILILPHINNCQWLKHLWQWQHNCHTHTLIQLLTSLILHRLSHITVDHLYLFTSSSSFVTSS